MPHDIGLLGLPVNPLHSIERIKIMYGFGNNQPKFPMPASGATPAAPMGGQVKPAMPNVGAPAPAAPAPAAQPAAPATNQYAAAQAALNGASQFAPGLKPFIGGMGPWNNPNQQQGNGNGMPPAIAEKLRGMFAQRQPMPQSQPTGLPGMNTLRNFTQPQAPMLHGMLPPVAENL
jgi:hypothetical protein